MINASLSVKAAVATAYIAWGLFASPAVAQEVTLKFATINAESTRAYKEIQEPLARAIEKDSGGRIKVDMRGPGANGYGKPAELLDMVEKGDIDIAYTVQGYKPGHFPRTTVAELPLLYRDSEGGTRVLWGLYQEGLLDKEYDGLKVLALNTAVPYGIFSATKPITTIKDFRGLRVRVPSPTVGLALARMGAVPIGLPLNLIGESVANGMVDAVSYSADSLESLPGVGGKPVADQVKAVYDCGFAAPALMIVMNQQAYDKLPKDLQKIIDDHFGVALSDAMAKDRDTSEASAKKRMANDSRYSYVTMTPEQHDEMVKLIAPVVDDWKKSLTAQGIDADKLLKRAQELAAQKTASAN
jgi:TRAP-type C4-dicarboxylate transport system substrate-binding protein